MSVSNLCLSYDFSAEEVLVLARFFRSCDSHVPAGMERLKRAVESAMYGAMTLEEMQRFYEG